MSSTVLPSKGIALLLSSFGGLVGADKFYVGAIGYGVLQLVLTLTVVGMAISIPWMTISNFVLVISILFGVGPMLYPTVEWAPVSSTDKIVAWIVVGIFVLGTIIKTVKSSLQENFKKNKKSKKVTSSK